MFALSVRKGAILGSASKSTLSILIGALMMSGRGINFGFSTSISKPSGSVLKTGESLF